LLHGIRGGVAFAVLGFGVNEYLDFYVQTSHSSELICHVLNE